MIFVFKYKFCSLSKNIFEKWYGKILFTKIILKCLACRPTSIGRQIHIRQRFWTTSLIVTGRENLHFILFLNPTTSELKVFQYYRFYMHVYDIDTIMFQILSMAFKSFSYESGLCGSSFPNKIIPYK